MLQSYSSTPYSFTLGIAPDLAITSGNDSLNGNWSYVYDPFNRLASSSKNAGAQTFSYDYDRYGNRWHQNAPQGGPAPQYTMDNTSNRISGSGVQYDALGNVTNDGLGNAYTYDAENRLIKVVNSGGTFNYAYDAEGRRVSNGTYEFLYDLSGRAVTQFLTSNGVPSHEMIYAGGRHVATYSAGVTSFMHADWLDTKRVMTTLEGTNAVTCTGLPFGDGLNCLGNDRDLNEFTGDIHDSESNTEHTWFRQLSAIEGRWLRPDPYLGSIDLTNPQSLNRYGYVVNSPMNLLDPLGLVYSPPAMMCDFIVPTFGSLCELEYDRLGLNSGGGGNTAAVLHLQKRRHQRKDRLQNRSSSTARPWPTTLRCME